MSAGGSWVGGIAPVNGDTIVIPAGCTITQDANITLGSTAGAVGHALTIAGAVGNHGKFVTANGFTLTLSGFNASNTPLSTTAYGEFDSSAGGTIVYDVPSNSAGACTLSGIFTSVCTTNRATHRLAASRLTWSTVGGGAYTTSGSTGWYDATKNLMCAKLPNVMISNAGGTALGSFGDSSLGFSAITPAGALTTEVATKAAVTSAGKYFVDYTNGIVFFYQTALGISAFTSAYKYLTFPGVTFLMAANANGNQVMVDQTDFLYMGNATGGNMLFDLSNKLKTGTERNAQIKRSTFFACRRILELINVQGTSALVPMDFTQNTITGMDGDATCGFMVIFRANNSYCDFTGTTVRGANLPVINVNVAGAITQTGFNFSDMVVESSQFLYGSTPGLCAWVDCVATGGCWLGLGSAGDTRQIENFSGSTGHPAVMDGVISAHAMRVVNVGQYSTVKNSILIKAYHHAINGPTVTNDILLPEVTINNCIRMDCTQAGAFVELGYNRRQVFDNASVTHMTDVRSSVGFSFGDVFDTSGGTNVSHRLTWASLLAYKCQTGFQKGAANASRNYPTHFTLGDYNAANQNTIADYSGWTRFPTITGLTNVTGVSLNNPSLAGPQSGKNLTWTHNSATDRTLTYDGGTPVQLVQFSGTLTTGGADTTFNGTCSDSGKTFNTNLNNALCPTGGWLLMTSGVAAGQARRITLNTATQLTTVAPWGGTVPAIGDTYIILFGEFTLTALGGATLYGSLYAPSIPSSTQSDTIAYTTNSIASDPQFYDETRTIDTWDAAQGGPGTEEHAIALLFATPTLARTSLAPYLRTGYMPTSTAYRTAGHDGATIGAVPYVAPVVVSISPSPHIGLPLSMGF